MKKHCLQLRHQTEQVKCVKDKEVKIQQGDEVINVDFDQRKVVIQQRYEWLNIINDLLLGVWFLLGSIFFFFEHWTYWGTWLFVVGSIQMMIHPCIQMANKLHMRRYGGRGS